MGQRKDETAVTSAKGGAGESLRTDTHARSSITAGTLAGKVERARQQLTNVFDAVDELMFIHDKDGRILRANRVYARHAGLDYGSIIGKPYWQVFPLRDGPLPAPAAASGEDEPCSTEIVTPQGLHLVCGNHPIHDKSGVFLYTLLVMRDVTAERQAERSLREANRALRTLSACNEMLVRATAETVLLQQVCAAIVDAGEFAAAWVGYTRDESPLTVLPMTQAGLVTAGEHGENTEGVLCQVCPARTAINTGSPVIDNDIDPKACSNPWSHCDRSLAARSQLALPLIHHDRPLGVLVIYAHEPNAFGDEEVSLLSDLANDLVYGIRSLRTERERAELMQAQQLSNERLQQTLVKTIESLAMALEKRDPYTSGHQQRVAALAVALAEAMNLDPVRVEGIRLGALIHDVGKIYVPSEILNRPGRLTDAEFALIKTHSEVGFEIVKQVEFPWPVAQMIRQHHERLDGSGYPDGLRDEQIILEARVLAVADVVEAMTSHRPYRPGLGVEAALEEIDRHRGSHYDPVVVDTCRQLFTQQAFSFDTLAGG